MARGGQGWRAGRAAYDIEPCCLTPRLRRRRGTDAGAPRLSAYVERLPWQIEPRRADDTRPCARWCDSSAGSVTTVARGSMSGTRKRGDTWTILVSAILHLDGVQRADAR
jgi:hypothetical protein